MDYRRYLYIALTTDNKMYRTVHTEHGTSKPSRPSSGFMLNMPTICHRKNVRRREREEAAMEERFTVDMSFEGTIHV